MNSRRNAKFYRLTRQSGHGTVKTTAAVRKALDEASSNPRRAAALPPLQVVSIDHYNSKWAVVAIEWLRRRRIAEHILRRPSRIRIEVIEGPMLPRGRFRFYNGVGALADMIAHLIQPLRALTGHATVKELLSALHIVRIYRARYKLAEDFTLPAFGKGPLSEEDLARGLATDTETFGVIELEFTGPPWNGTHVFIRTGKGFARPSKTIVVEGFDDDGPVALVCDIDKRCIRIRAAGPQAGDKAWIQTQAIDVPGLVRGRPLHTEAKEYVEVFSALCAWDTPDPRFFPGVEEAAYACDFFYQELLRDRAAHDKGLQEANIYPQYETDPDPEVRRWLADDAGWD
jgi:hypothetical protein